MSRQAFKAIAWAAAAAAHGACLWGYFNGGFPWGIFGDSIAMLACADAALCALLATLALRDRSAAIPCAASAAAAAACAALAWAPPLGAGGIEPSCSDCASIRYLQANLEGKGLAPKGDIGRYDIAFLAEWSPSDDLAWLHSQGMEMAAGDGVEGDCAIASKWRAASRGTIEDASGWAQACWARLETPWGPLWAISAHTRSPQSPARSAARDDFLEKLARFAAGIPKGEPTVAMGDFNATWGSASLRRFATQSRFAPAASIAPTWPTPAASLGAGFRIDHQFAMNGSAIESASAFDGGYSDHLWTRGSIAYPRPAAQRLAELDK